MTTSSQPAPPPSAPSSDERPGPGYVLGLDLAQASDFTALAVVERTRLEPEGGRRRFSHGVRHLKRWPLKTPYTQIVADVAELVGDLRKAAPALPPPVVVVDQTGVGRAVVELVRGANLPARVLPVLITAGHAMTYDEDGSAHVPKKELVSTLQALLQSRRLVVAPLPERELLVKELLAFRVKITVAANETFEAWRERDHDDLVLAVALACWGGEQSVEIPDPPTGPTPPRKPSWDERLFRTQQRWQRRGGFPGGFMR